MSDKPAGDREMRHFNSNLQNYATAGQAGSGRRDVVMLRPLAPGYVV
jgi:hypothetical protein